MESNPNVDSVTETKVEILRRRIERALARIESCAKDVQAEAPNESDHSGYANIRAMRLEYKEYKLRCARDELVACEVLMQLASAAPIMPTLALSVVEPQDNVALTGEASIGTPTVHRLAALSVFAQHKLVFGSMTGPTVHRFAALSVFEGVPLGTAEHERAVAINWTETAARHLANEEYWRGRCEVAESRLAGRV